MIGKVRQISSQNEQSFVIGRIGLEKVGHCSTHGRSCTLHFYIYKLVILKLLNLTLFIGDIGLLRVRGRALVRLLIKHTHSRTCGLLASLLRPRRGYYIFAIYLQGLLLVLLSKLLLIIAQTRCDACSCLI